jgi:hypothetical protein
MPLTPNQVSNLEKKGFGTHMEKKEVINKEYQPPLDFTGNSNKSKTVRPKVQAVVQGTVQKAKKSPGRVLSESFLAEDAKNVGQYILMDVLIPAAKSMVNDIVSMGIERLLYGSDMPRKSTFGQRSNVSYGRYFKEATPSRYSRERVTPEQPSRSRHATSRSEDMVFESRSDAEEVLTNLTELVESYGQATVSDFCDLVGVESTFVDLKYGWEVLGKAYIQRIRDGYIIHLPEPIALA